ncbi:coatomer alpha subunit, putative [Entamoeba invadens IP1]|uniref:Coatomer alpha subunit, putative n=1 Tax=Entamoeba invadens IP1 TaxID=370355 RepID=A0A0A1TX92_ENTIV|nr:coatomer alpha subunit, putative [Entamoeba invadens IP1]ELP85930.1 coatomer alpha subunit, putative [Entamoeba invadens IP1]|eukprot:XP_004185276.1 coatomer alpha subunit, putative [Entamoeba invadens IP1]
MMRTQLKFNLENKSDRVKMAVFHPTSTLLMCSLHNGDIQIWDYRTKIMLHSYPTAHTGAIRGLSFHPSRPLVVSGGDDCLIKMWNYRNTKAENACVGVFKGHTDYVRSTYFHPTKPWILSCSDDRTIRIWNYLSLKCIAIMTGHDHFVLSAHFHPKPEIPMVISSSYDGTVRVWDIKDLYENEPRGDGAIDLAGCVKFNILPEQLAVNYAIFHPTVQLIFTCGDDKTIKMWRYNDTSCWNEGVFRGHTHNVTACTVMGDYLISVSEDKCVNVFEIKSQKLLRSFRTEGRIWCVEKHPLEQLFAIGSDVGLKVFKLFGERPMYFVSGKNVYYQCGNSVNKYDVQSKEIKMLYTVEDGKHMVAIPQAKDLVMVSDGENYQIFCGKQTKTNKGSSVCYVGGKYFLALDGKTVKKIDVMKGEEVGTIDVGESVKYISAGNKEGVFLCFSPNVCRVMDVTGSELFKVEAEGIRRGYCSKEAVVIYGGKSIVVMKDDGKKYAMCVKTTETSQVKSAIVVSRGVVLYSTNTHIKYLLPSGEIGIVQNTGNSVLYLMTSMNNGTGVLSIDRQSEIKVSDIDLSDVDFKAAVLNGDLGRIKKHLESTVFIGDAIISFLLKYKYADLALLFVRDTHAKFNIGLQCGNFRAALEAAKELGLPHYWRQLAQKAIENGQMKIGEFALVQLGDFNRVTYLCGYTGNQQSAERLKTLDATHSQKVILGLLVGDKKLLVKESFLANGKLGYIAAQRYGFKELAEKISKEVEISEKLKKFCGKERKEIPFSLIKVKLASLKEWPCIGKQHSIEEDISNAKEIVENDTKEEFKGVKIEEKIEEEQAPVKGKAAKPVNVQPVSNNNAKAIEDNSDDEDWNFV